ncbi:MAG: PAS domain S-box protein [Chloroflexota bacterium]
MKVRNVAGVHTSPSLRPPPTKAVAMANIEGNPTWLTKQKLCEELSMHLLNSSPIGIYIAQDGKFQLVNSQFAKDTGYSENELLTMEAMTIIFPQDQDKVMENVRRMAAGGCPTPFEHRVVAKNGEVRWIVSTFAPTLYRGRQSALGYYVDITESKRTEEELRQSQEKLRVMFESLAEGVTVTDLEGNLVEMNEATLHLHGYTHKEELIGRSALVLISPKDHAKAMKNMKKTWEEGYSGVVEFEFLTRDGGEFEGELNASLLKDEAGRPAGLIAVTREMTERKLVEEEVRRSEELHRALAEAASRAGELYRALAETASRAGEGICMLQDIEEKRGTIVFINDHLLKMLEYAEEEALQLTFTDVLPPRVQALLAERYASRQAGEDDRIPSRYEVTLTSKSGREIPVELGVGITNYKGKVATIVYVRDLTEAKKSAKALEEAQGQLLQSEKLASIGQLAAGVAHELNNPIAFIASNLEVLAEYVADIKVVMEKYREMGDAARGGDHSRVSQLAEEVRLLEEKADLGFVLKDLNHIVQQSQEGTHRVRKTVIDLRNFARADQAESEYADINECVESTLNIVWNELKYKATVQKELGDIPRTWCYPSKLGQVFMNLLVNAAQAIPKKGEIGIKTFHQGGDIYIQVSDTGCGIPEEHLSKIFEPFFTTKPVGRGTGLGLSVAYGIIQAHDGSITVESEVGKGSTFTVRVPVTETQENGQNLNQSQQHQGTPVKMI